MQAAFLMLMLAQAPAPVPSPAGEVLAAHADARRLPAEQARVTRYLTLYSVPVEKRTEFVKVLAFHVNSLSREAGLVAPRRVSPTLVAIEIDAYGWEGTTYGSLHAIDPWFHARAVDPATGKQVIVHAPWLSLREIAELSVLTGSVVPLLRADWFINQTGQQAIEPGYYDFLGLKKLEDLEKLAGLDRATATRVRREVAAIVDASGVANQNRQLFRFGTVAGAYWESRDVATSTGKKNAVRNLDGDFEPDAFEIFATLPNGLWATGVANAKRELQAAAPSNIAGDKESTSNDVNVRTFISCFRCHKEDGLRPIDDFGRKTFRVGNETGLGSPDREKAKRLKQLYLGPLNEWLTKDRAAYAEALKAITGMKSAEFVPVYVEAWKRYESGSMLPADVARELGCTERELLVALRGQLAATGLTDLALAGLLSDPPVPMRREHLEEFAPVLMPLIQRKP